MTVNGLHSARSGDYNSKQILWEGLTTADGTGHPAPVDEWPELSFQVTGTFGGCTVVMQGSNDGGTTWATLRDDLGNALGVTAAGLLSILEPVDLIRPYLSVAGAGADVDVTLFCRRPPRGRN